MGTYSSTLTKLFSKILLGGKFPHAWKHDRRTPIHKPDTDTTDVSNYRLLAIHSVFRKLFCTIIDRRLRQFIELDDAQNAFRQRRRTTDNVLILQGFLRIASRERNGAHVLVADFRKAFDSCHIPTLITKLAARGVGGVMLRVIADMYTGAKARLIVNGVLGRPFYVTQGVAQGCALSPLFFDIYIDDLLLKFRESGLGVPLGALTQSALSFADDLILLSSNEDDTEQYLHILDSWCRNNHLFINPKKSGILRVGAMCEKPLRRYKIHNTPIQYLDEKDPYFENIREFKYLGFCIPKSGDWKKTFDFRLGKARQALGQYRTFFYDAEVRISLKLRLAP